MKTINLNIRMFHFHLVLFLIFTTAFLSCKTDGEFAIDNAIKHKSIDDAIQVLSDFPNEKNALEKVEVAIKTIENLIDNSKYGNLIDERDGKIYKTILMRDGNVWMAENLNFYDNKMKGGSWCYNNKKSNCDKFGRLYTWKNAMKACPKGWHLPTDDEWWNMIQKYGGAKNSGGRERSDETDGKEAFWKLYKDTKFKVQLGGNREQKWFSDEYKFVDIDESVRYWSSTSIPGNASIEYYFSGKKIIQFGCPNNEGWARYCRCIKNK